MNRKQPTTPRAVSSEQRKQPKSPHGQPQRPLQSMKVARRATQAQRKPTQSAPTGLKKSTPAKPPVKGRDIIREDDIIRVCGPVDRPLLVIIMLLLCIGSVMVFSASYAYAYNKTGDSFYYITRHLAFVGIGFGVAVAISRLKIDFIRFWTPTGYVLTFLLLIAVLVIGVSEGSAQRWIPVPVIGTFQPSELMKLMLILVLALYYDKYEDRVMRHRNKKSGNKMRDHALFWYSSFWGAGIPGAIVASVCVMIMLESHLSGTIIMFLIGCAVIFVSGAPKIWLVGGGVVGTLLFVIVINTVPYMKKRFDMFLHPENYASNNDTWQTNQGKIAVGSGGFLGVGLGESRQKHMFVSQPQNDFIFSIVCEELGFVGATVILCIFAAFVWRTIVIAMRAQDTYCRLAAIGIASHIAIQTLLNVAVVTDTIPNTGISLPFFSYGGSSMVCLMIEMGVLLCISRYSYQQK